MWNTPKKTNNRASDGTTTAEQNDRFLPKSFKRGGLQKSSLKLDRFMFKNGHKQICTPNQAENQVKRAVYPLSSKTPEWRATILFCGVIPYERNTIVQANDPA